MISPLLSAVSPHDTTLHNPRPQNPPKNRLEGKKIAALGAVRGRERAAGVVRLRAEQGGRAEGETRRAAGGPVRPFPRRRTAAA